MLIDKNSKIKRQMCEPITRMGERNSQRPDTQIVRTEVKGLGAVSSATIRAIYWDLGIEAVKGRESRR
jgi:hypothetical protein